MTIKHAEDLRRQAEELLNATSPKREFDSLDEMGRLLYELNIYQTELEMQNHELAQTQLELMSTKEKLLDLYDFAPVSYVTISPNGQITSANLTATKLFEQPRKSLIGSWLSRYIHPDDSDQLFIHFRKARGTDQRQSCDLRLIPGIKAQFARLDSVRISRGNEGTDSLRIIITDVTAETLATRRRDEERKEAECEKVRTLGTIAGGVAHDFNNLLTPIVIYSQFLSEAIDAAPESNVQVALNSIARAAESAAAVCTKMLDFAGPRSLKIERVSVATLLESLSPSTNALLPPQVKLVVDCPKSLPDISGDPTQIHRLMINLISNAVEAMVDGGGNETITIAASVKYCTEAKFERMQLSANVTSGRYLCIAVADSGCGMESETLAQVFDPFFTTKFSGRGLGMASVMGIARDHCAAIDIETSPEDGTCVSVYFPISDEAPLQSAITATSDTAGFDSSSGINQHQIKTILLVDDNDQVRTSLETLLELTGFSVKTASSGQEAVEIFTRFQQSIDLVVLDLVMPIMDGVSTFEAIYKIDSSVAIVMMSGYADAAALAKVDQLPIRGFVKKPFSTEELLAVIQCPVTAK